MRTSIDIAVIGGGIVGLATARALVKADPGRRIVVLEKEDRLAAHQTGRNSGVLHSGIYYKPGSAKARTCATGRRAMLELCERHSVPHEICGKVIVAVDQGEAARLPALVERGQAGGVRCEMIGSERLAELEPHVAGVAAIEVPDAGIIDFVAVCRAIETELLEAGVEIRLGTTVLDLEERSGRVRIHLAPDQAMEFDRVVNCGGLHADTFTDTPNLRIVPFRGEYYELVPEAARLVNNLVYPVPDPRFPFLGVHLTRMVHGGVHAGPNAVLALAREGYRWRDIDLGHLLGLARYPGFRRLVARHFRPGMAEVVRSVSKKAFVRSLQRLVPEIQKGDLVRSPAGVRAQALGLDGALVDDFVVEERGAVIHLLNAPSPAATAALAIGAEVAARLDAASAH